jgi:hypothetical protein
MYEIYRAGESKSTGESTLPSVSPTPIPASPSGPITPDPAACRTMDDYSATLRREHPTSHVLAAFAPKPLRVSFESQNETEQVVLLLRQHPIVLLKHLLILIAGLISPIILNMTPFLNFLPDKFHLGFLLALYMVLIGFALQSFLVWFFNVYIVTDERIIDVDFLSIIYQNVSAAKIDNIEDVTANTSGAAESLFNYGTVFIQTAAEKNEFEFENVPHPNKVAAILNDLMLEEEREHLEGRVS